MITSFSNTSWNDLTGASALTTQKNTLEFTLPSIVSFDGSCGSGWSETSVWVTATACTAPITVPSLAACSAT
jgi:hypothetical protein